LAERRMARSSLDLAEASLGEKLPVVFSPTLARLRRAINVVLNLFV
ncbi:hypothetical protein A2U01_0110654, partial [Trifolium medium]|nr:hypothetical protein [Trifolium medium]